MSDELQLGLSIVLDDKYINEFNKLMNAVRQIQKQLESFGDPLKKIKQPTADINAQFDKVRTKIDQSTNALDGSRKIAKGLGDTLTHNVKKMAEWAFSATLLYGTLNSIKKIFQTISNVEVESVNIRKVLPNDTDFAPFQKGAQIISQQFGVSITDTLKAMQSWARQVKDTNSIMQLTNASMLAAAVTDITLESSYKALSSIIKQFNMDVAESNHVVSTFNELSNNMRVTAEDLAQGLAKTGSAAKLMGVDFDRAAGLVGTLVEVTSMTGSQAGTVLSRMFSRIHTDDAVNELQKLNINAFQPMSKTLDELGLRWNNLTKAQQENVAKALGGTHHYQKLLALFSNYNRVIEATIMAYDSMGSAEKEMQLAMSTYQKKLEQLKAAFQSLVVNLGNNMLPAFKNIIDGFRILITYHDGIIPKLALVAAGIWGLVTAFKALAAVQTITMTGWLGIGAVLITGAAYLVGMSNSSKQATDSLTQLNNSMNIVNTSMTNLSKASERVRQVEYLSEMHEKLNAKLKTLDKSSKDYIDTLNLYKKVQIQINNLGNQYGIKLDKGKSQYEAEREQVSQLISKLKELETQKQRMYEKDLQRQIKQNQQFIQTINQQTFGDSGPNFFDLKRYYYQAWQKRDKEQIQRGREMTERWIRFNPNFSYDQINQHISDFRKDPTGWFKSMTAAYNQAQKNLVDLELERTKNALKGVELGDWGDPGKELPGKKLKDKIQPILTDLDSATLTRIETIGRSWQDNINKALSAAGVKPEGLLQDDKAYYVLKDKSGLLAQETTINKQLRDALMKPFEEMDKAAQELQKAKDKITFDEEKTKAAGKWDIDEEFKKQQNLAKAHEEYQQKLKKQYEVLEDIQGKLDPTSDGFEVMSQILKQLRIDIGNIEKETKFPEAQKYLGLSANQAVSAINTLADSLIEFGVVSDSLANSIKTITNSIEIQGGKITFNKDSLLSSGINQLINGVVQLLSPSQKITANKWDQSGYSVAETMTNFKNFEANKKRANELMKKLGISQAETDIVTGVLTAIGTIIGGPIGGIIGNILGGLFGGSKKSKEQEWKEELAELQEKLKATWGELKKALGTSIEDVANAIGNAFQATNYVDFLSNFSKSLYDMTRQALIKGFMAQEAYQKLYTNLSDIITVAVMDGAIDANEIAAIKTSGNELASQMRVLYQALGLLDTAFPGVNQGSSGEQNYTAGSSVPITYNNYITIQSMAFAGNEDEARSFALLMRDYIVAEEGRG